LFGEGREGGWGAKVGDGGMDVFEEECGGRGGGEVDVDVFFEGWGGGGGGGRWMGGREEWGGKGWGRGGGGCGGCDGYGSWVVVVYVDVFLEGWALGGGVDGMICDKVGGVHQGWI